MGAAKQGKAGRPKAKEKDPLAFGDAPYWPVTAIATQGWNIIRPHLLHVGMAASKVAVPACMPDWYHSVILFGGHS